MLTPMGRIASLLMLASVLLPVQARADVPPPPGYVEQCTIEKQCKKGEEGDACRGWHGDREGCQKRHASDGFVYKCRSRGASVWTEVFCRPKAKPTK